MTPIQWLRSLAFVTVMYALMPILGVFFLPLTLIDRQGAHKATRFYCRTIRWLAGWMVGLRSEIRGPVPQDEVLIASKHQSFFDIIMIVSVVPRAKFIMKKSLVWAPVLGWYAMRMGCVPVDRGKRGQAIQGMLEDVAKGRADPGQLIIYPQGTRVAPGRHLPYKIGTGVLYRELGQDCAPAATNVGLFWPRTGIGRKPGLAVVEFLDRIPAGQEIEPFMAELETRIETASTRLMAEAGWTGEPHDLHRDD